jgi:hypothetical protein
MILHKFGDMSIVMVWGIFLRQESQETEQPRGWIFI